MSAITCNYIVKKNQISNIVVYGAIFLFDFADMEPDVLERFLPRQTIQNVWWAWLITLKLEVMNYSKHCIIFHYILINEILIK
jgi:hypothetical protein